MKRDAQATKQRIFDAATTEFARYGIAGARVDRIAAASASNKGMIYAYYGSKEGLFGAVGTAWLIRETNAVPFDTSDLPEYAALLFDQYQTAPEMLRLITWAQLELGSAVMETEVVEAAWEHKTKAIWQAQQEGRVGQRFSATDLLELIMSLTQTRAALVTPTNRPEDHARRRAAIKETVRLITLDF